jgi:hypothetical protein
MIYFSVPQANSLIPALRPKLESIARMLKAIRGFKAQAVAAASASENGGGAEGGSDYVKVIYEFGRLTTEVIDMGIEIKDPERGLIDFPCLKNGEVIYLCWQLGEGDEIEWWHDPDAGFAGRQRL